MIPFRAFLFLALLIATPAHAQLSVPPAPMDLSAVNAAIRTLGSSSGLAVA